MLHRIIRQDGNDLLSKLASLAGKAGVDAEVVLLEANRRSCSRAIVNEARHWEAALIVREPTRVGVARLVLGSVAEGVLHFVPMLLIRCP